MTGGNLTLAHGGEQCVCVKQVEAVQGERRCLVDLALFLAGLADTGAPFLSGPSPLLLNLLWYWSPHSHCKSQKLLVTPCNFTAVAFFTPLLITKVVR